MQVLQDSVRFQFQDWVGQCNILAGILEKNVLEDNEFEMIQLLHSIDSMIHMFTIYYRKFCICIRKYYKDRKCPVSRNSSLLSRRADVCVISL